MIPIVIVVVASVTVTLGLLIINQINKIMTKLSELEGVLHGQNAQLDLIQAGVDALKTQIGDPPLSEGAQRELDSQGTKIRGLLDSVSPTPPAIR